MVQKIVAAYEESRIFSTATFWKLSGGASGLLEFRDAKRPIPRILVFPVTK